MRRHYLYLARRFFSRPQGESSPLIKHLDVHISSETALPRAGKSKLKRNLDAQSLPELTTSQLGALQSAEEEILETLEECLQSNSMLGAFPNFKHSSQLIQISKVKVNRDLSHVDVIWGSQILEGFINRIYETSGKAEGKRMKDKIFKKTNLQLQKKEGTFRTFLMRAIEFRRVPRYSCEQLSSMLTLKLAGYFFDHLKRSRQMMRMSPLSTIGERSNW
jgi:ribosome-binding factor A